MRRLLLPMMLVLAVGLTGCLSFPQRGTPAPPMKPPPPMAQPAAPPMKPPPPMAQPAAPPILPAPPPPPAPVPAAITGSKLTVTLTSSQGKKVQVYLFAADEQARVQEGSSCMAQAGDTVRYGHYDAYLLPQGAKEPVAQSLSLFGGESLAFNDQFPHYLTILTGEQGGAPDVLLLQQYGSCNGKVAVALALSPDATQLIPYNFVAKQWKQEIGISGMEQLVPGKLRTSWYNNATGIYTDTTWEVREAEKALVATSVEERKHS